MTSAARTAVRQGVDAARLPYAGAIPPSVSGRSAMV